MVHNANKIYYVIIRRNQSSALTMLLTEFASDQVDFKHPKMLVCYSSEVQVPAIECVTYLRSGDDESKRKRFFVPYVLLLKMTKCV